MLRGITRISFIIALVLSVSSVPASAQTDFLKNVLGIGKEKTEPQVQPADSSLLNSLTNVITPSASQPTADSVGFLYSEEEETILRQTLAKADYDAKRLESITKWKAIYNDFLMGNYDTHTTDPEPITAEEAQQMVALDTTTMQRLQQSLVYRDQMSTQMAEWTFYYEQLDLWNRYVEQELLETTLTDEEKVTFDPTKTTEPMEVHEKLKAKAKEVQEKQKEDYWAMVDEIEGSAQSRRSFESWLEYRNEKLAEFSRTWARRHDGTSFQLNDTLYVVRHTSEKPADGRDILNESKPEKSALIEVPHERLVTPMDLINADGSIKSTL